MFIDTHCHLDATEFDADREAVRQAALVAGVDTLVVPAVAAANFPAVQDCCRRYPGCLPAYGIHPLYTGAAREEDLNTLRAWLASEKPVAVGEIGLDFFVPGLDSRRQEWFFIEQLKLAREFGLPVLLHVRRSVDQVLKQLRRIPVPGGIAHAFNGSPQQAEQFLGLGFKLGFGGTLTFEGSRRIRHLAATLPLDALVLETDAPDIPPAWLSRDRECNPNRNPGRNSPAELPRIAAELAALRAMPLDDLARATRRNAWQVLPPGRP